MVSQYVDYGCCNVVDGCRSLAYLKSANHTFSDPMCINTDVFNNCSCCITPDMDDYPSSGQFVSPVADPAPWYNPDDPRSQHYLGAMIYDQWKESQPYIRETIDTTTGGKTKRGKLKRKEIVARFILLVDDCCAIDFAKATFLNQFLCASTASGACELPSLIWHECYDSNNCDETSHSIRGFPRAAMTSINWIDDEIECCLGTIAEVTFSSELPWVYEMCPENIVTDLPIIAGEDVCKFCEEDCPEVEDPCVNQCLPLNINIPKVTLETCYCEPISIYRNCFAIPPDGRIGESTLKITINTGSGIMRNFRIKAYANKFGFTDPTYFRCETPCIDIAVAGPIKANSILEIDGVTRDVWLTCNNQKSSGRNWVESTDGSPFSWPDIACDGLLVCLESSAVVTSLGVAHTAPDATISIERLHRELR